MDIRWLTPQWPAPAGVCALSTLRGGGVSAAPYTSLNLGDHVGDEPATVAENRRRLRVAADLPAEPHWLAQVHGIRVEDLDAGGSTAAADGAHTRRPGRICAILTADCLPVLFAAESGEAVAAAHAGWRGLAAGVIEATVRALAVEPRALLVWLGPSIGPQHFEVGAEVRDELLRGDRGAEAAFTLNGRGRFMADLGTLRAAGSHALASSGSTAGANAPTRIPTSTSRIGATARPAAKRPSFGLRAPQSVELPGRIPT